MSNTPYNPSRRFRSPNPTPRSRRRDVHTEKITSDSEESVASTNSDNMGSATTQSSNGDISLVAEFDDLMRIYHQSLKSKLQTEKAFVRFVEDAKAHFQKHFDLVDECKRLQALVDKKTTECSDLQHALQSARHMMDKEKQILRTARRERDDYASQLNLIRDLLFLDKRTSIDEMRRKLAFLQGSNGNGNRLSDWDSSSAENGQQPQLSAIKEVNSTGDMLSDFSYSRSEDDLETSRTSAFVWKKHRPSTDGVDTQPPVKKRRSSAAGSKIVEIAVTDTVKATTTLTVSKEGPITATSIIESVPKTPDPSAAPAPSAPPAHQVFAQDTPKKPERRINTRQHCFQQKIAMMPENCGFCDKRIRFGKTAYKCKECKATCHSECKDNLPLPCVPSVVTPNQRNGLGVIGDYTPINPPMVPAILIHCINEIELRGLNELGIYRIPGSERDVKALRERFLRGKGAPSLNQADIHVICGTVKYFLRCLREPLVTYGLRPKFVDSMEKPSLMYDAISELPQPNRDTLAYMMLHLQKVAEADDCKMNISNLAKVFGPTIVGYSSEDPERGVFITETRQQHEIMEMLLSVPSNYWSNFVNVESCRTPARLQQTPSTDSLLRSTVTKGLFSSVNRNRTLKNQKFFPSPKNMSYR